MYYYFQIKCQIKKVFFGRDDAWLIVLLAAASHLQLLVVANES